MVVDIEIPSIGRLEIRSLVLDFTGTLSVDGVLIEGVRERITELSRGLKIYVLTADTFGKAAQALQGLPLEVTILKTDHEDRAKEEFVRSLGADSTAAMGNGSNDSLMLQRAALGIAVLEDEGCSAAAIRNADMVVKSIRDGFDLLLKPLRLKAGLRR